MDKEKLDKLAELLEEFLHLDAVDNTDSFWKVIPVINLVNEVRKNTTD